MSHSDGCCNIRSDGVGDVKRIQSVIDHSTGGQAADMFRRVSLVFISATKLAVHIQPSMVG